jgi:hypothetical protein
MNKHFNNFLFIKNFHYTYSSIKQPFYYFLCRNKHYVNNNKLSTNYIENNLDNKYKMHYNLLYKENIKKNLIKEINCMCNLYFNGNGNGNLKNNLKLLLNKYKNYKFIEKEIFSMKIEDVYTILEINYIYKYIVIVLNILNNDSKIKQLFNIQEANSLIEEYKTFINKFDTLLIYYDEDFYSLSIFKSIILKNT